MNTPMDAPMSSPVECENVRARLAIYLAGELREAQSLAIEAHAGECAACEVLLDAATRVPVDAFAPALPAELRARTLEAVSARARSGGVSNPSASVRNATATGARTRAAARWIAVTSTFAAAAMVFLMVRPQVQPTTPRVDSAIASLSAAPRPENLADESARPEFAELERAASELEAELTKSPGDAELRTFLEAVNTRRMELERRVKDARS